jgi:hypothetical protein
MAYEPFLSSRLKIERAKCHISELNSEIAEFLSRDPYRIIIEDGPDSGQCSWTIRVREEVPIHFPTILGDAVHNLRTALDILACDLVRLNEQSPKDVYFPFCLKRDDFEGAIRKRHIDRAAPEVLNIIRRLEPYEDGAGYMLRAIHDLDIIDKHQLLIPVVHCVNIPYTSFSSHFSDDQIFLKLRSTHFDRVKDGTVLCYTPITDEINVGQNLKFTFEITFGDGQSLEGQPIIPQLYEVTSFIARIIENFEALCLGKKP